MHSGSEGVYHSRPQARRIGIGANLFGNQSTARDHAYIRPPLVHSSTTRDWRGPATATAVPAAFAWISPSRRVLCQHSQALPGTK
eukprot:gene9313-biopygen8253